MPNRYTREGWIRSRRVAATERGALLLWHAIKSVADDYGRFNAEAYLVLAACFPRPRTADPVTEMDVSAWLEELARTRLIAIYQAGDDRLLQLFNFQQRPRRASKYPAPPLDVLDGLGEPEDSVARRDAGHRSGPPAALPRKPVPDAECAQDRHARSRPPGEGSPSADEMRAEVSPPAAGIGYGFDHDYGGGSGAGGAPPPDPSPPTHSPELETVQTPRPALVRPPVWRMPDYVASCEDCSLVLRTLNDLTCRTYTAAGRAGELLHRAHEVAGVDKALRAVRSEVERLGQRAGKSRYLAPFHLFDPSQWDTAVNALEGGVPDVDELRPLRV